MKKHIFETKKTKLIARVMLLVLLLASALSFAGCGEPHIKKGQYYKESYTDHSLALKIVSNTEEFALNDVTFRVYIGLHKRSHSLIDWLTTKKMSFYIKPTIFQKYHITTKINTMWFLQLTIKKSKI